MGPLTQQKAAVGGSATDRQANARGSGLACKREKMVDKAGKIKKKNITEKRL